MIAGILLPGHGYTTQAPLLDLAAHALADRRAHVEDVAWTPPDGLILAEAEPFVRAYAAAALRRVDAVAGEARPVIIAKSLGTFAAAFAAERGLPAIWLTPVLTDPGLVAAIAANPAPALLIGGTADRLWVPGAAESTGKQIVTIPGGDHGLRVPGPLRNFTDALATVAAAMETFLDRC
jgi:hypothetical protein